MRSTSVCSSLPLVILFALLFPLASSAQSRKPDVYQKWLEEDVCWIITDQQRAEFRGLSTDQQRDQFIEAFWLRRDPTPGTPRNEFKEEHYRRIAYSNVHFADHDPGWKTDRGHVYIVYGPPKEISTDALAVPHSRLSVIRDADGSAYPFQVWRYRQLGQDRTAIFVDRCRCGDYKLDPDFFKIQEHD